jgi:hypothetical protein
METPEQKEVKAFEIIGNWDLQSRQLKLKFPLLTDADMRFEKGKEEEFLTRIGLKINKGREEVINIIKRGQPRSEKI